MLLKSMSSVTQVSIICTDLSKLCWHREGVAKKPNPQNRKQAPTSIYCCTRLSPGSPWNLQNQEQSLTQGVSWQMWVVFGCQIKIHLEMQPRRKPPAVPSTALANQGSNFVSRNTHTLSKLFPTCRLQR